MLMKTSNDSVSFTRVRRLSKISYDCKRKRAYLHTFFVGNDRRIESPWDVKMSADYANRSITVKLYPLRDTNVRLSKLGKTRTRVDYETDRCSRLFNCPRLFISSGNGTNVLYITWNNTLCKKRRKSYYFIIFIIILLYYILLFPFYDYFSIKIFKQSSILFFRNIKYFLVIFVVINL